MQRITFSQPQPIPVFPPLKLIPIPFVTIPSLKAEEAAIGQYESFQKQKQEIVNQREEKIRIEQAKKDAFAKVLIPEKTSSSSELSENIAQQKPDLSEFDAILTRVGDDKSDKMKNDFNLLKEVMGVQISPHRIPSASIVQATLPSLTSNLAGDLAIPVQFQPSPAEVSTRIPFQTPPTQRAEVQSLGRPVQMAKTYAPPIVQLSPSKKELFAKLPSNVQTYPSLLQMGFEAGHVRKAMDVFATDREILDFLFFLQEMPRLHCDRVLNMQDAEKLRGLMVDFSSLVEMGTLSLLLCRVHV